MPMLNHPNSFTSAELTAAVNKLPTLPHRLARLFSVKGISTTTAAIDVKNGRLYLVEDQDRNAPPKTANDKKSKRSTKYLACAHLPQFATLGPSDLQDVRGFGIDEPVSVETAINDRMQELKDPIDNTIEFHRLGAVKGIVVDADGTTPLHDYYSLFGVAKNAVDITFPDSVPVKTNPVLTAILKAKRLSKQKASGLVVSRYEALVGSDFYDALTGHELVREAHELWQAQQQNWGENDYRQQGFTYGGVTWYEASEEVNGKPLVAADKAHLYPVAPGVFQTFFAPANWMSAVNTVGRPYYAQIEPLAGDRGYSLEVQSNPLCACMYPETLVELTAK